MNRKNNNYLYKGKFITKRSQYASSVTTLVCVQSDSGGFVEPSATEAQKGIFHIYTVLQHGKFFQNSLSHEGKMIFFGLSRVMEKLRI